MSQPARSFMERVLDDGQWYDIGVRVEYVEGPPRPGERYLEKAALGSCEVLSYTRVEVAGIAWLDVGLRRFL